LSSWKICLVATPLAFQEIQVLDRRRRALDVSGRDGRGADPSAGIFLIVTSRPFFLKMPACFGERQRLQMPVHPGDADADLHVMCVGLARTPEKAVVLRRIF
jgi:hypothetical protein